VAEESIQCALSELEANNACGPAAERVRAPQDLNSTRVAPVPALLTALLLATVMAAPANAEGPTLKVNVFQGMHTVELHIAPSPDEQRAGHFTRRLDVRPTELPDCSTIHSPNMVQCQGHAGRNTNALPTQGICGWDPF
jgi:hypothetical protein